MSQCVNEERRTSRRRAGIFAPTGFAMSIIALDQGHVDLRDTVVSFGEQGTPRPAGGLELGGNCST